MQKSLFRTALIAASLIAIPAAFAASMTPTKTAETAKGKTLTDAKGMTLYTFDKDSAGKSACNDKCATNWPPLAAKSGDKAEGDYSVIKRDEGKDQWAYKGKPLYTWIKDKKAGDVTGDGVANNTWHVAQP